MPTASSNFQYPGGGIGAVSYVANIQALGIFYKSQPNYGAHPTAESMTDGTSNTIVFAERYAACPLPSPCGRAAWLGVIPVVAWNPFFADTRNGPNILFPEDCPSPGTANPWTVQSGHPGGMNVLLADSSVRGISPGISTPTWWHAVLPNDGYTLGSD